MENSNNGKDFIGQVAIRHGNDYMEPAIVYVYAMNNLFDDVSCKVLNKTTIVFGGYFEPMDMKRYEELRLVWEIENAEIQLKRANDNLYDFIG